MQATLFLSVSATLCLLAMPAPADVPPPISQLRADCKAYVATPDSPDSRRCRAYIQGILDGIVVSSKPDAPDQAAKTETFSERALRTRLRERDRSPPRSDPAICGTDAVPTTEVVRQVIAHLDTNPPPAGDSAATVVYAALRARFPCKPAAR